jgi:glycosyltransferase involved in cell wall biosynthesis
MRIAIAGPISTDNIAHLLSGNVVGLPHGYYGAPLLGTLIDALLERGHTVTAFTTSPDMLELTDKPVVAEGERFKAVYCPIRPRAFRYSNGHMGRAFDAFRLERQGLRQAMQNDRPDVVHAHWTYEFALAAIESGLPHVITCHDAPQVVLRYMPSAYRLVRYFMAKRVLARASCLTAVSPYLKKMVEGCASVPVTVIPNPLPGRVIHAAERLRQYDPTSPRIAMVLNGWGKRKNPQPALRAFALLRQRIPGAELHVTGSDFGPGEKAEAWARAHGVAKGVHFLGRLTYSDLLAQLAESDLLLHPSLEETFGMSIAEAMALGVPVVGGERSGAVPWVIGTGGIVTDVTQPSSLCEAMYSVFADPELNMRLCTNARENAVNRFDPHMIAAAYDEQYHSVLSES